MEVHLTTPITQEDIDKLNAGDKVRITGTMYTSRDAGHKRMVEMVENNEELPMEVEGQIVYYAGPAPAKPGEPIGSVGPTTAYRMDRYSPRLMDEGLKLMIGKGGRSPEVIDSIIKNKGVYFLAIGGAAAYMAKCVKAAEVIAFDDLGPEALRKLTVENFPVTVGIDSRGNKII